MSRRTLLGGASALGAGLAGLVVAGCGDSDEEARTPTAAATPTQPGQSPAPAATAAIPEELVITMEREPVDLMPFFGGFDQVIAMRAINETLVHVTMRQAGDSGRATVSYDGMLAESWQHPEPTVWLFKLRDGVKFHDGTPWDAPAAVANFDAFRDTAAVQALRKQFFGGRFIAGVGAVDERTLRIETTTPLVEEEFFGFGFYLGFTATSPAVLANGGFQAAGERPTGTGPYRFQAWRKGQDIILVRNEDYWGSLPNMRRLKFIWRPEASVRAQTVKAGESHFAFNIGAEQASALEKSVVGGGFQSNTLRLNNTKAPTSDVRVRQAINYALDREAINKAIFKGLATPIGFFAYQPVDVPIWPYDPARARALLSQAGAAGREVELVYGESRIPEEDQLAEIFAAQIGAVGLKVKLTKVERAQYNEISAAEFTRQPELLMETTSSGNYGEIASSLLDKYGCSGSGTFCSPEWDRKFGTLLNMAGPQRLDTISDIARRLQEEETPRAWILAVNQVHGLGRNVRADLPLNVYVRVGDLGFV
jgi:peptide/nickel transport system substrate-binding protein